jgi:hypothetical protein
MPYRRVATPIRCTRVSHPFRTGSRTGRRVQDSAIGQSGTSTFTKPRFWGPTDPMSSFLVWLHGSPDEMAAELRRAAGVRWYSRGLMYQKRAEHAGGRVME